MARNLCVGFLGQRHVILCIKISAKKSKTDCFPNKIYWCINWGKNYFIVCIFDKFLFFSLIPWCIHRHKIKLIMFCKTYTQTNLLGLYLKLTICLCGEKKCEINILGVFYILLCNIYAVVVRKVKLVCTLWPQPLRNISLRLRPYVWKKWKCARSLLLAKMKTSLGYWTVFIFANNRDLAHFHFFQT